MDAPGATPPDESAVQRTTANISVRSRSSTQTNPGTQDRNHQPNDHGLSSSDDEGDDEEVEDEEESDDEEPRLKYAYLTKHLGSVYRNGDATSSFLVAGDKMVCSSTSHGIIPRLTAYSDSWNPQWKRRK